MKVWKMLIMLLLIVVLPATASAATANDEDVLGATKVEELLEIAASAQKSNYTTESWQVLEEAVTAANEAIASGSQLRVNKAGTRLAKALSQLTSMDYSRLDPIIQEAERYMRGTFEDWLSLFRLLISYQDLYGCGSQAAVDQAVEKISYCLDVLYGKVVPPQQDSLRPTPEKAEQKSAVVWIVLLGVSVLGNIGLVAVMVLLSREHRKKEEIDDVPLVDYDIDDDVV